jgi:hypothetical protein
MPYCPNCLTEYVEATTQCEDCGTALQPGSPPPLPEVAEETEDSADVTLVRIRTFSGPTAQLDADLARNLLRTQGIFCTLPGEMAAEALPGVCEVHLLVRKEDAEKAVEFLTGYLDTPGPIPVE